MKGMMELSADWKQARFIFHKISLLPTPPYEGVLGKCETYDGTVGGLEAHGAHAMQSYDASNLALRRSVG